MSDKASLGFAHPCLLSGGSESVVLWGVEGLWRKYGVGLVTGCSVDLKRLNQHCDTQVQKENLDVYVSPQWPRQLMGHTDALRGALFARYARAQAHKFDVCISGYNILDFGKPAIQLIADFSFDDELRRQYDPSPEGPKRWGQRSALLRRGYIAMAQAIAGSRRYGDPGDWIVANSHWTAGILQSQRGIVSDRVIYPPVLAEAPVTPWEQRVSEFVILGRVSPEKRIDRVIDILGRVRARGHDAKLHVIGHIGDDAYGRLVGDRIAANPSWCVAEGTLVGVEKTALLTKHRYAIHGRYGEPFGIAVAEEVKAGCIPFVPREGGPVEIVGTDELTYADEDEAVAKIVRLLDNPERQGDLRDFLARQAKMFSAHRFMSEVRCLVDDWLMQRH